MDKGKIGGLKGDRNRGTRYLLPVGGSRRTGRLRPGARTARWLLWVPLLLVGTSAGSGQGMGEPPVPARQEPAAEARLEQYLVGLTADGKCPAIWAGKFWHDGSRRVRACAGVRKWGAGAGVELADRVHLGSCTKAMTAVMVAQLVSGGKLSWNSRLGELFPECLPLQESGWKEVAVIELLHHASGLPANAPWGELDRDHPGDPVAARRAMLGWISGSPRPDAPEFLYSNVGYALLGHIVETVEGEPWERLVERRLFEPLAIRSAGLGPVRGADALDHPWGHRSVGAIEHALGRVLAGPKEGRPAWVPVELDNPPPLGPAGRVHMSMEDWSKFVRLFASEVPAGPPLGIAQADWRVLVQPGDGGGYAGGWIATERQWAGGMALTHTGSNTTWFCVAWVAPRRGFSVLVAANAYAASVPAVCDRVAARLVAGDFDPPSD